MSKFFVYGTLKQGGVFFETHEFSRLVLNVEEAVLHDYKLVLYDKLFPGVIPEEGRVVIGQLMEFRPSVLEYVEELMDYIEGVAVGLYMKREVMVGTDAGMERAKMYVPNYESSGLEIYDLKKDEWTN